MKTVIALLLILASTSALAVDENWVGGKSAENLLCQIFNISCTKVDEDGIGGKSLEGTEGQVIKSDYNRQTLAQEVGDIDRTQPNK